MNSLILIYLYMRARSGRYRVVYTKMHVNFLQYSKGNRIISSMRVSSQRRYPYADGVAGISETRANIGAGDARCEMIQQRGVYLENHSGK